MVCLQLAQQAVIGVQELTATGNGSPGRRWLSTEWKDSVPPWLRHHEEVEPEGWKEPLPAVDE